MGIGFSILAMLFGVICQVLSEVAATEKQTLVVQYQVDHLNFVQEDSEYRDFWNSCESFKTAPKNPRISTAMSQYGFDPHELFGLADTIFKDRNYTSFAALMGTLNLLNEPATQKDILK